MSLWNKEFYVLSGLSSNPLLRTLKQFVTARVLIRTDENKYNLAHDYLAPYVQTATEGTETNAERANRLLKRYTAEYREDPKSRIPLRNILTISKYASPDLKDKQKTQELLKKSKGSYYTIAAFPLLIIAFLYAFLASSYYFSIENSYVVLRSGHPQLKIVPGFDKIVIQTNFKEEDLISEKRSDFLAERVIGFWIRRTENSSLMWGKQILPYLDIATRLQTLRLVDSPELVNLLEDNETDIRSGAANTFGIIAEADSEIITPEVVPKLIELLLGYNFD